MIYHLINNIILYNTYEYFYYMRVFVFKYD